MSHMRALLSIALVLGVAGPLSAAERTLIDFTTFDENIKQVMQRDQEIYNEAIAENPELDIRANGWPDFEFAETDWDLSNWRVELNPSAQTPENNKNSMIKPAPSQQHGTVLGVRLAFKPWANPFWATISMPFYFNANYTDGTYVSETDGQDAGLGVGLLVNTGQLRNVRSWIYGLNYDYKAGVRVRNENDQLIEFGFGSIFHEGWRRLSYVNPFYLEDVNDWKPVKNPLYPFTMPYLKFDSFAFYKPEGMSNPHFFGYVRDVTIDSDLAVVREDTDIDDEALWKVVATEAIRKRSVMSKRIAEELLLRRNLLKLRNANQEADAAAADGAGA
ncbi:MAG: flagellar filament outer layer protein FlaA [Brevinema sp.]